MKWLERMGWTSDSSENPDISEIKEKEKEKQKRKQSFFDTQNIILRWLILIIFGLIILFLMPRDNVKETFSYTVSQPWRHSDLTAPITFSILKTDKELEKEEQEIRKITPPIFYIDHSARINIQSSLDSLFTNIQPVLKSYLEWQQAKLSEGQAPNDSMLYVQEKSSSGVGLSNDAWQPLLDNYVEIRLNEDGTLKQEEVQRFIGIDIRLKLEHLINEVLNEGIINISKSELTLDEITIRDSRERTERTQNISNVRDIREAREFARYRLNRSFMDQVSQTAHQLFTLSIEPNLIYNAEQTQQRINQAIDNISKTKGAVTKEQVIIRKGDIVTEEKANTLRSLAIALSGNTNQEDLIWQYLGDFALLSVLLIILWGYLFQYKAVFYDNKNLLLLKLILLFVIGLSVISAHVDNISPFMVPIAIAPILLAVFLDAQIAIVSAFFLALYTGLIHGSNLELVLTTVAGCTVGIYKVKDFNNRTQLFFGTPGVVLIIMLTVAAGFSLTKLNTLEILGQRSVSLAVNTVLLLFTYPLALLFEKLFRITTDFTLVELNDTNHPLIRDLMSKAPGTFHHSLQVGNLAASAAVEVGGNPLLCRVGALFHDIGKMNKPEYFVENQTGYNVHDKLKPRLSAQVIKAHVSDGVEMAEEANLPAPIIDFIRTHHGTTLIKYFYDRAVKEVENENQIREEDFRYDGPLPHTLETGILLMADGIEAASRAMKNPNAKKLESLVNRMVDDRVKEGQLANCPITFSQLERIKTAFKDHLPGLRHERISYDEDEELAAQKPPSVSKAQQVGDTSDESTQKSKPDSSEPSDDNLPIGDDRTPPEPLNT
ncbi:MAG: HD family phosphohydrolase [Bacteroidota bacterium]